MDTLTLEQCRELIPGSEDLSDEKILEIRDELYKLAELAFDIWRSDPKLSINTSIGKTFDEKKLV